MADEHETAAASKRPKTSGVAAKIVLALFFVIAISVSGLLFYKYRQAVHANPANETKAMLTRIGTVFDLPDEDPAVATVADKSKITNESLANKAENGDKLLVFAKAKRLLIYRPSNEKVIDILTITSAQDASLQGGQKKKP